MPEELKPYEGKWVAFVADGRRIVASGDDLFDLLRQIKTAGHDPQDLVLERIELEEDEIFLGGAELL